MLPAPSVNCRPASPFSTPSQHGLVGEFGPFFETVNGTPVINHAHYSRSDYVSNALAATIHSSGLEQVDAQEMIARMETLRACIRRLPPNTDSVPTSRVFLVQAEKVADWTTRGDRLTPQLTGPGYLFVFAATAGTAATDSADETRVRQPVATVGGQAGTHTCQLAVAGNRPSLFVSRTANGPINVAVNP
jgi:hypothetical protein